MSSVVAVYAHVLELMSQLKICNLASSQIGTIYPHATIFLNITGSISTGVAT